MEPSKYNASQQELYEICRLAWTNYYSRLAEFTAFRPRYTAAYGNESKAEIDAAEALPSDNARSGLSESNRILLTRAADDCLIKWQSLKRYILDVYTGEHSATMLKIAGQAKYTDSNNYKWQSLKGLMNDGAAFISDHETELIAKDNMPPSFGADFGASKSNFDELQAVFFGNVTDSSTDTQNKVQANNALFVKVTKMLQDGQVIFSNDDTTKQKFTFNYLKGIVSGVSQAGIKGFVTDAATNLPLTAATVATANNRYTAITDDEGRFDLKGMAANDYSFTISAIGYNSQVIAMTVKTGTVSNLNVGLEIAPASA